MSASCRNVERAVTRRLDDRLDAALWLVEAPGEPVGEMEAVQRHLDACPQCRASWEAAQRLARASVALAQRTARTSESLGSPEFVERVWNAWRDAEATPTAPKVVAGRVEPVDQYRGAVWVALAWAAALVLAVALGWRLGMGLNDGGDRVDPGSTNLAESDAGTGRSESLAATVAVDRELARVTTATLGLVRRASEPAARVGRDLLEVSRGLPDASTSSSSPRFRLLPLSGWNEIAPSSLESEGLNANAPEPEAVALADLGTRDPSATVSSQAEDSWAIPALRAFRFVLPNADVSSTRKDPH